MPSLSPSHPSPPSGRPPDSSLHPSESADGLSTSDPPSSETLVTEEEVAAVGIEGRYALPLQDAKDDTLGVEGDEKGELEFTGHPELAQEEQLPWTYPEGGKGWWVVLGCFMYAGSTMGWGLVWGVFQTHYKANVFPQVSEAVLTLIGGVAAFSMTATSFVSGRLGDRFGYKRTLLVANTVAFVAFLLSSFCTKLWQIFLVQGVFTGFGLGLSMPLYMALPSQWFLKRRGLATGIAVSGSGVFGGINTLLVRLLIVRIGSRHTLLVFTFVLLAFWVGAYFLLEERVRPPGKVPAGEKRKKRPWLPMGCWRNPSFYSFMFSIFFSTFGFLTPYSFITSYTRSQVPALQASSSLQVTLPLLVMNLCGAVGRIFAGLAADSFGPVNMFTLSLFIGGSTQLVFWQFSHTYATIMGFSALYGLFGSMFLSLLPVVAARLFPQADLATLVGFGVLVNAPGQLLGSTIAGSIRDLAGGKWEGMICFSGGMTVFGSLCMLYARFKGERRVWAAF